MTVVGVLVLTSVYISYVQPAALGCGEGFVRPSRFSL